MQHPPLPPPGGHPVRDRHDDTLAGVQQTGRPKAVPRAVLTSTPGHPARPGPGRPARPHHRGGRHRDRPRRSRPRPGTPEATASRKIAGRLSDTARAAGQSRGPRPQPCRRGLTEHKARGRSAAPASGSQGSARNPRRSRHGAPGLKHRFLPSPSVPAPPPAGRDNGPLSRPRRHSFRARSPSSTCIHWLWLHMRSRRSAGTLPQQNGHSGAARTSCRPTDICRQIGRCVRVISAPIAHLA